MRSHFNDEFLVLLGPIISMFFACSSEEKNKPKQQRVCALVLSLCKYVIVSVANEKKFISTGFHRIGVHGFDSRLAGCLQKMESRGKIFLTR